MGSPLRLALLQARMLRAGARGEAAVAAAVTALLAEMLATARAAIYPLRPPPVVGQAAERAPFDPHVPPELVRTVHSARRPLDNFDGSGAADGCLQILHCLHSQEARVYTGECPTGNDSERRVTRTATGALHKPWRRRRWWGPERGGGGGGAGLSDPWPAMPSGRRWWQGGAARRPRDLCVHTAAGAPASPLCPRRL